MNIVSDFFSLRPVFTFVGLRIAWYIYLLHMIIQLYVSLTEVSQLLAQRGISWLTWLPNFLPALLGMIAQIVLVRLLFEVAGTVLLSQRQSS
jgi:VanZ family protein